MSTDVRAYRPGWRSMTTLVGCEARMVIRDTAGLIVPFALPLMILLTSGSAGGTVIRHGRTAFDLYVLPLVLVIILSLIGILNMPSFLAYYRRSGILRRMAVTPASPAMVLGAQVVVSIIQAALGIGFALAVAFLLMGANPPVHVATALGVTVLAALAMYGVGMVVAAVAPTPNSAVAISLLVFFTLAALGGMFGGMQALPDPVAQIGALLPFGAAVEAIAAAWAGTPVQLSHWVTLSVTTVLGAVVAGVLFRWE
ncbi:MULTISPECIES: ABC transporter permease [unclassified Serinicoccus]|uniref:ABC transporter permease n=1 Tax=unclassified Serinicoccus TaxID=2643101 RepID=UPI0038555649